MRRFRLPSLATITTAAVLLSAASLAGVAGPAQPASAAATGCPWVGSSAPISQRVSQLMARMTTTQKVDLLTGASGSSYVGLIPAIGSLCIPAINLEDGPAGVGDGMTQRDPAARAGRRRRDLGHLGRAALRPGDRVRAGRQGHHHRPRADHQHRA